MLRTLVRDSLYRQMYLSEIGKLVQKWDTAKKKTAVNLANINALQSAIAQPYFPATDLQDEVARDKGTIAARLFHKEYSYLWEPEGDGEAGTAGYVRQSFHAERGLMQFFIDLNWGYYVYALVIGLLYGVWVWNNRRRICRRPDGEALLRQASLRYIQSVPVLATLAVILNILPFFNLDAPTIFTQLGQSLLMIVVSILFWLRWPRKYFLYWGCLLLLYICHTATGPLLGPARLARFWLLALDAAAVVLAFYGIRKVRQLFPYPPIVRVLWWVCLVLDLFSLLCNITGRLSLSKLLSTGSMFGLAQIIVLTVCIDCILEGFTLQTLVSKSDQKHKHLVLLFQRMQKRVERLLIGIALLAWIVALAINLNVYDAVHDAVAQVWNHVVHLGKIAFRLGNVLLFLLIVYLSNVLQQYIGYLYGVGGGSLQTGKKGSQLVMIRLVLIIVGFLLAIAASGLPIDRITIVLGALGVGIGLGLQNIVNNLVSGIILIFERPFQLGDYIELNGKKGVVRDIGIRSSRMVTETGTEIIMPNGDLLSGEVINWTVTTKVFLLPF